MPVQTRRSRRVKLTLPTGGVGTWTTPVQVEGLGLSGVLDRYVLRSSSAGQTVSIAIWQGDYAQEPSGLRGRSPAAPGGSGVECTVTDPVTEVAYEDHLLGTAARTGIATLGSLVADDEELTNMGQVYDVRRVQRQGFTGEHIWVSVRLEAGVDVTLTATLEAVDTL